MSSSQWPIVAIDSIKATKKYALNGGPFGSKLVSNDYVDHGIPVIRGVNLPLDSRFSVSDFVFVSEDKADDLIANNAHPGDVVFTQRGTLGQVGIIPKECGYQRFVISQSQMKLTVDDAQCDPLYIYYCFRSETTVKTIKGLAISAGVPHINLAILREFTISKPPLPTQRKIASILSAYDDLIENNTRRIAILEAMAQAIYREWFVEFRFPGHEKVKLVDSPLGKIPAGWCKHLSDVVTLKRGYDLPQRDRRLGTVPLVSSSGITDCHDESMVKGPGVVTGRYGTLGEVFYIQKDFWPLNTTLYVRDFHGNEPLLVVHLLRSLNLASQNAAGAVPGVNRNALHLLEVIFPPPDLQKQITPTIEAIECSCRNLRSRNENLRTTRDLLLPKLISGQLDVEDLDIETCEAVTIPE